MLKKVVILMLGALAFGCSCVTTVVQDAGPDCHSALDAGSDSDADAGACSPCQIIAPQCGCGEGLSCYPGAFGNNVCSTPGGPIGWPCRVHSDCAPTLACYDGTCARVCVDPDTEDLCAGPYSACVHYDDVQDFATCNTVCNPETSLPCGTGLACRIESISGWVYTQCRSPGVQGVGESCTTTANCQRNLTCVPGIVGGSYCRRICSGDSSGCICDFSRSVMVNGTKYGYCP